MEMERANFVPDDYIQQKELNRANFFYLAMLGLVAIGLAGTFAAIRIRQAAAAQEASIVDDRFTALQQSIMQLEQLHSRRQQMFQTALITAELIEPLPRSIVLAMLTNYLPQGTSLSKIKLSESKISSSSAPAAATKYDALKNAAVKDSKKDYITVLEIEGLAASDIEVADYIAALGGADMLENVSLVYAKEVAAGKSSGRQFKLTSQIRRDFTVSSEAVERICNYKTARQMK